MAMALFSFEQGGGGGSEFCAERKRMIYYLSSGALKLFAESRASNMCGTCVFLCSFFGLIPSFKHTVSLVTKENWNPTFSTPRWVTR